MGCTPGQLLRRSAAAGAAADPARAQPDHHARHLDAGDHRAGRHPRPRPGGLHRARQGRHRPRPRRRPRVAFIAIIADRLIGAGSRRMRARLGARLTLDGARPAAALAFWSGPVEPEPLGGGITNTNFLVADAAGSFVVRIGDDIPVHHICAQRARRQPAPPMPPASPRRSSTPSPARSSSRFIDGRTLTPADVRDPANLDRIADHRAPLPPRGPAATTAAPACSSGSSTSSATTPTRLRGGSPRPRRRSSPPPRPLEARGRAGRASSSATTTSSPPTSSTTASRLWLIDWEYAGFNTAALRPRRPRLQHRLDRRGERTLLLAGLLSAATADRRLLRQRRRHDAASLLREAMWSMVSELHSTLDFDYAAYTAENRARFDAPCRLRAKADDRLPASARIVVIGGGIIGCSTAYHLAAHRKADVILIERAQADLRLHLARRRPRRPAPLHRHDHPAARLLGRPLQPARGRDRPRHRLEDATAASASPATRTAGPSSSARRRRPAASASTCTSCRPPEAKDLWPLMESRRPRRRGLHAHRRAGRPLRHRPGARQGRPHARRADPRGHPPSPAS